MGIKGLVDKIFTRLDRVTKRKDGKEDYCSIAPDVWFGKDISSACLIHDIQYADKSVSRREADKELRENIITIGKNKIKFKIIGWVYWVGVRIGGSIY